MDWKSRLLALMKSWWANMRKIRIDATKAIASIGSLNFLRWWWEEGITSSHKVTKLIYHYNNYSKTAVSNLDYSAHYKLTAWFTVFSHCKWMKQASKFSILLIYKTWICSPCIKILENIDLSQKIVHNEFNSHLTTKWIIILISTIYYYNNKQFNILQFSSL